MAWTKNSYHLPLSKTTKIDKIVSDSPGHPGPYKGAVDFAVALNTPVLAPLRGEVITIVDRHSQYGASIEFANKVNYIQIRHDNSEISDLMHLAKNSALVKVGDKVVTGQEVAKTGKSGYMTAPHLHWFVFVHTKSKSGFEGLKIKLNNKKDKIKIY